MAIEFMITIVFATGLISIGYAYPFLVHRTELAFSVEMEQDAGMASNKPAAIESESLAIATPDSTSTTWNQTLSPSTFLQDDDAGTLLNLRHNDTVTQFSPSVSEFPDNETASATTATERSLEWTWQMIVGVTFGGVFIVVILGLAVVIFCHRCYRRCCDPSAHDSFRFQGNSSPQWEDTVTLSYINAQFDLKDNSEEFASLENDTFLNSLESMMFVNSFSSHSTTVSAAKL